MKHVLTICLLFLILLSSDLNAQRYTRQQQQELKNINKELQKNKQIISKKKKEEKSISTKLGSLKRNILVQSKKLKKTDKTLHYYQGKIQKTSQKLIILDRERQTQLSYLSKRVETVYKNKYPGFIEFIFSPKSYKNALSEKYFFDQIMNSDISLIKQIKQKEIDYQEQKQKLRTQESYISTLKKSILQRKQKLSSQSIQTKKSLNKLRKEIKYFEQKNALLEKESEGIRRLIQGSRVGKKIYYAVGKFIKPSKGWISSRFGYRTHPIFKKRILHRGVDIAAPRGYQIRAANHGKVLFSGWQKGYGNVTIINHGWKNGHRYSTIYAHQSRIIVKKGQSIKKGQLIGYVGSTGYSTGPHLHFELRKNGKPINPTKYVNFL